MSKRNYAIAAFVLIVLCATPLISAQYGAAPFSGDLQMSGHGGTGMQGKLFFGGSKMRMEMNAGGRESIVINDLPKKTSYLLMPQQKMYLEMSATGMMGRGARMPDIKPVDPSNPCSRDPKMTCKKLGTETVNGRSCDKWEITREGHTTTAWIDQKLHWPIKSVSSEGGTWELKNIKEGAQPASLFEVPRGYRKMDMGGMMGQRPPR